MPLEVRRSLAKPSRGFYQVREEFHDNLPKAYSAGRSDVIAKRAPLS